MNKDHRMTDAKFQKRSKEVAKARSAAIDIHNLGLQKRSLIWLCVHYDVGESDLWCELYRESITRDPIKSYESLWRKNV